MCGGPDDWPQKFLSLRLCSELSPAIGQLQFRFSYLGTGSFGGLCFWVYALASCSSLYFSNFGAVVCPVTPLLCRIEEELLIFFSLFSFLLVRVEWQLLASYVPRNQKQYRRFLNTIFIIKDS